MLSVRARITLIAAALSGLILVVGSFLLVGALDRSLTRSSDTASRAKADQLAVLASHDDLTPALGDAGNGVIQVVASSGRVLAASRNVADQPPITRFEPSGDSPQHVLVRGAPDDRETEDYRVWAQRVTTPHGAATVYVGDSLESVHEATASLRRALYVGIPATLAVLIASTWFLVGRAMRPVEAIRAEVATITESRLDRRVPVPGTDDEVGRLARTMNDMLDRLDRARRRERDFIADASHELLSPLAASRAILEVGPADGADDATGFVPGLLAENVAMERIVRNLLFLARDEAGAPPDRVPLDLDDIVLEEAARVRDLTELSIDTSHVSAGPVRGDRDELRRLVRNLLENNLRYAATAVRLCLRTQQGDVRLDVSDDGPGIDPRAREHVFERFYRADAARSPTGSGGAGLGLAIARAIALRHRGTLELADTDRGAHFVLTLPADDPEPSEVSGDANAAPSSP